MDSMFGIPPSPTTSFCADKLKKKEFCTFPCLIEAMNCVFKTIPKEDWKRRREALNCILNRTKLSPCEVSKYALFDSAYPYTRNLIATDEENYTLLLLCWNAGMESKVHNHPCDGCFVRVIKGAVKETRYEMPPPEDDKTRQDEVLKVMSECIATEGEVTYMDDYVGLHKIGNPSSDIGAISLHLYTPPYSLCKVSRLHRSPKNCSFLIFYIF
jgi:cysteine dioxygenase